MNEVRIEIIQHAIRWCSNILVEVLSNYAAAVGDDVARDLLRDAIAALAKADDQYRRGGR